MAVTAGAELSPDRARQRRDDLIAELRQVEYWRRLVTARLDLAVAAVTAIDDPVPLALPRSVELPSGLREIVGLPAPTSAAPGAAAERAADPCALSEVGLLLRLRQVIGELDEYARALHDRVLSATEELAGLCPEAGTGADLGWAADRPRLGALRMAATGGVPELGELLGPQ